MFKRDLSTVEKLTREMLAEPDFRKQKWDHLFVWVEVEPTVANLSGFVYRGDEADWADVGDPECATLKLFRQLRQEMSEEDDRGPWDACLYRLDKGSDQPDLTFLWGAEADEWRITPVTARQIREKARPR